MTTAGVKDQRGCEKVTRKGPGSSLPLSPYSWILVFDWIKTQHNFSPLRRRNSVWNQLVPFWPRIPRYGSPGPTLLSTSERRWAPLTTWGILLRWAAASPTPTKRPFGRTSQVAGQGSSVAGVIHEPASPALPHPGPPEWPGQATDHLVRLLLDGATRVPTLGF